MERRSGFSELDFNTLNVMYEREKQQLTAALLNGASWEEVQDQRRLVTSLAIERHKKNAISHSPGREQGTKRAQALGSAIT